MNKIFGLLVGWCLFFLGCGDKQIDKEHDKLYVVVTTGMIADAVRNIGKDYLKIDLLMGPGVDPHTYKLSPGDIKKLQKADLIIHNGLHLEGKMGESLNKIAQKKPVLSLGETLDTKKIIYDNGQPDPHIWMNPSLWSETLSAMSKKVSELDPAHLEEYENNRLKYEQSIKELHQESQKILEKIPMSRRVLITAHDAFRYFGKAYNVEVRGIQGISTESEAGLKEINQLVRLILSKDVHAVFVESSVSQRNIMALLEGARNRGQNVKLGGQLYSDSMGDEGTPESTYVGMIRHNVKTIVEGLK